MSRERQLRQAWITRFDFLAGALPGGVEPSDIDQVLERHGHFLFIECKRPYQRIPTGQRILFDNLVRLSAPAHRVELLLVVGDPPDRIVAAGWWRTGSRGLGLQAATAEDVRAVVLEWWRSANG